jgi:hypothetical protein
VIPFPKYADKGFAFRSDKRYLAVLSRAECKDVCLVYDCITWDVVRVHPNKILTLEIQLGYNRR